MVANAGQGLVFGDRNGPGVEPGAERIDGPAVLDRPQFLGRGQFSGIRVDVLIEIDRDRDKGTVPDEPALIKAALRLVLDRKSVV